MNPNTWVWANRGTPLAYHTPPASVSQSASFFAGPVRSSATAATGRFAPNTLRPPHSWAWTPGTISGNRNFGWGSNSAGFHHGHHHHGWCGNDFFFAPACFDFFPDYYPAYPSYPSYPSNPYYDPYAYNTSVPPLTIHYANSGYLYNPSPLAANPIYGGIPPVIAPNNDYASLYNPPPAAANPVPFAYGPTPSPSVEAAGLNPGYVDYFAPMLWYGVAAADPLSWEWYLAYLCCHLAL